MVPFFLARFLCWSVLGGGMDSLSAIPCCVRLITDTAMYLHNNACRRWQPSCVAAGGVCMVLAMTGKHKYVKNCTYSTHGWNSYDGKDKVLSKLKCFWVTGKKKLSDRMGEICLYGILWKHATKSLNSGCCSWACLVLGVCWISGGHFIRRPAHILSLHVCLVFFTGKN